MIGEHLVHVAVDPRRRRWTMDDGRWTTTTGRRRRRRRDDDDDNDDDDDDDDDDDGQGQRHWRMAPKGPGACRLLLIFFTLCVCRPSIAQVLANVLRTNLIVWRIVCTPWHIIWEVAFCQSFSLLRRLATPKTSKKRNFNKSIFQSQNFCCSLFSADF